MSDSFADAALHLAGFVCRQLGWNSADFWAATPAEIAAIFASDASASTDTLTRNEFNTMMERERHG